ncbi:MAG: hypothetical protein JXQ75_08345 [Phycisphaerae bacterium]|nr:hypothetical protein [Phycisphaerae bacterium]
MFTQCFRWGGVALVLAASICVAQEKPEGGDKPQMKRGDKPEARRGDRRTMEGPVRRDPQAQADRLIKELGLDEGQQAQVRKIFEECHGKMAELREALRLPPEAVEKMKKLRDEMKAAREDGNEERMRDLSDQMRAVHEERRKAMEPVREEMGAIQEKQYESLLAVMREDQKPRFEDWWEEWIGSRQPFSVQRSPRALKAAVGKLPDLTAEQKEQIDELFAAFKKAVRDADQKSPEYKKSTEKLYDDVIKVLTPEQQQTVEKKLRGRGGPEGGRRHHGRPGGPGPKGKPAPGPAGAGAGAGGGS